MERKIIWKEVCKNDYLYRKAYLPKSQGGMNMQELLNCISKYYMELMNRHIENMEDKFDIGQVSSDYYRGYRDGFNRATRDFQESSRKALEEVGGM